jgi:hypothetical protein
MRYRLTPRLQQVSRLCNRVGLLDDEEVEVHDPIPPHYLDRIRAHMPDVRKIEIRICLAAAFDETYADYLLCDYSDESGTTHKRKRR